MANATAVSRRRTSAPSPPERQLLRGDTSYVEEMHTTVGFQRFQVRMTLAAVSAAAPPPLPLPQLPLLLPDASCRCRCRCSFGSGSSSCGSG